MSRPSKLRSGARHDKPASRRPAPGAPLPAPARPSKRFSPLFLGPRRLSEEKGSLLIAEGFDDYALLDMGEGEKLERYGAFSVIRPEPQAMGPRRLDKAVWRAAHAAFTGEIEEEGAGRWKSVAEMPASWDMTVLGLPFLCKLTAFRHLGVFPEQIAHWTFMREKIHTLGAALPQGTRPRLLNLFGYTGVASLIAAAAGAEVTHVDASKKTILWGRENQARAGLAAAPIRWITEDALLFTEREVRRGNHYHGILVDPPRFGRGPAGEVWELMVDLPYLLHLCEKLLLPGRSFLVLTAYAIRASFLAMHELAADIFSARPGRLTSGELALRESGTAGLPGRLLGTSLYARFEGEEA